MRCHQTFSQSEVQTTDNMIQKRPGESILLRWRRTVWMPSPRRFSMSSIDKFNTYCILFSFFPPTKSGQPSRRPEDACNSPNFDAHATDSITLVGKSLIAKIFRVFAEKPNKVRFCVNLPKQIPTYVVGRLQESGDNVYKRSDSAQWISIAL